MKHKHKWRIDDHITGMLSIGFRCECKRILVLPRVVVYDLVTGHPWGRFALVGRHLYG